MKFKISRELFLSNLSVVAKAISNFSPLPVLSGICIDVNDDGIILTASDIDLSIRSKIKSFDSENGFLVYECGSIVLEGKYLIEIIRKMDCLDVMLETKENNRIIIKGNKGKFILNGVGRDEYPDIDFSVPATHISLSSHSLKQIVSKISFACSDKDKRPVLTGVNFNINNNMLFCTSTDSYRLSRKEFQIDFNQNINITVPKKSLQEVVRCLSDTSVDVYIDRKKVQFVFDETMIQSRLIDGVYPNVNRIIPNSNSFIAKMDVDSSEIISVIERSAFIKNDKVHLICLELSSMEKRIKSKSEEIGNSDELLSNCEYIGDKMILSCNGSFMLDAIKAIGEKKVRFEFFGPMKPIKITGIEDTSTTMIVVPVKCYL